MTFTQSPCRSACSASMPAPSREACHLQLQLERRAGGEGSCLLRVPCTRDPPCVTSALHGGARSHSSPLASWQARASGDGRRPLAFSSCRADWTQPSGCISFFCEHQIPLVIAHSPQPAHFTDENPKLREKGTHPSSPSGVLLGKPWIFARGPLVSCAPASPSLGSLELSIRVLNLFHP